jgi:hypothetical protein
MNKDRLSTEAHLLQPDAADGNPGVGWCDAGQSSSSPGAEKPLEGGAQIPPAFFS